MWACKNLFITPLAVCLTCLISFIRIATFHHSTHTHTHTRAHTDTRAHTASKSDAPNAAPLLWSLPESQAVEDIKTGEEEQEDQNYQCSSKAGGAKPRCVSPFLPFTLPLSSNATWSLVQVTALFNDAICLMPSCGCQSISHYPSSCLSHCITRTPWLQHTKEQRTSPETLLQRPIRSILQTNWWDRPRKRQGGNNNKQQQKQGRRGRWWAHLLSCLFPNFPFLLIWEVPPGHKLGWGSQRGKFVKPWVDSSCSSTLCCFLFPSMHCICPCQSPL